MQVKPSAAPTTHPPWTCCASPSPAPKIDSASVALRWANDRAVAELRVQAAGERFPEGYEDAVKRYFRTLSDSEGQE